MQGLGLTLPLCRHYTAVKCPNTVHALVAAVSLHAPGCAIPQHTAGLHCTTRRTFDEVAVPPNVDSGGLCAVPHPPGPVCAGGSSLPRTARPVQVDMYVRVCVCVRGLDRLRFRLFCLSRPSAPACPGLGFRCMRAAWLHVAPAVGAVPLCLRLVPRWHRVRCDVSVVCWLDAFTAAWFSWWGACYHSRRGLCNKAGDCRLWLV